IEIKSIKSREKKKVEWEKACEIYEDHTIKISSGTCKCPVVVNGRRCERCYHKRRRKRMRIGVHEDFLPKGDAEKAAVVFELGIPKYLAAYRDVTWKIFSKLGHPTRPSISAEP